MCGIAGIINFNEKMRPSGFLKQMTNAMKHRGPDDEGFILVDNQGKCKTFFGEDTPTVIKNNSSFPYSPQSNITSEQSYLSQVGLGHRRLSIIDLSPHGHQPMSTEDGRYWIVYNGEVYNYKEIRNKLITQGELFASDSDTEVILKAFRRWGPNCLQFFNGMWAFAIWDNIEKKLFCARDRIGIKPFYYYLTNDFFLFASDIKTLIASGLYHADPNWEGIYHNMSLHCTPRPMTSFKGVLALEQAHWMSITPQKDIYKQRYWHIPVGEIDHKKSEGQWLDEITHTLRKSVKRRLISDVPVGTFMSGGIDSTTVSAIAAQEHPGIKAFTLGYENTVQELDEVPQAEATANMWPMQHIVKTIYPESCINYISEMVRKYEEPYFHLSPGFMISQLVKQNDVKVVLNGLGGDELFCGYGRQNWFADWSKVHHLSKFIDLIPNVRPGINYFKNIAKAKDIFEIYLTGYSIFNETEKKELFLDANAKEWNTPSVFKELYNLKSLPFEDHIEALDYMDIINYIGNHHVYRNDQFTMHFSLEGRFPFLDHELVELACRTPSKFKVSNGVEKYILRKVAKDLIHPSCLEMKKKGFTLPVANWMKGCLRDTVNEKTDNLKRRNIFSARKINAIINNFYTEKESSRQLWFLVMLENWLEEFKLN